MEQEKFDVLMMEYISDRLGEEMRNQFEAFLSAHPDHREQVEQLRETWTRIDEIPTLEPTEKMDHRFFDMLHNEIEKSEKVKKGRLDWFSELEKLLWRPQIAYGILVLVVGVSLGYFLRATDEKIKGETTVVQREETEQVREQLVLTLLEQPSANKRLQGIGEANKIQKVDEKVIAALLQTLTKDTNVNVRLAAIESLTNYLDNARVREGLVQAIVKQDSPIVQVTLANLMVALQEKKSIAPFQTLMRTKELDTTVKQKLETSIKSIL